MYGHIYCTIYQNWLELHLYDNTLFVFWDRCKYVEILRREKNVQLLKPM